MPRCQARLMEPAAPVATTPTTTPTRASNDTGLQSCRHEMVSSKTLRRYPVAPSNCFKFCCWPEASWMALLPRRTQVSPSSQISSPLTRRLSNILLSHTVEKNSMSFGCNLRQGSVVPLDCVMPDDFDEFPFIIFVRPSTFDAPHFLRGGG